MQRDPMAAPLARGSRESRKECGPAVARACDGVSAATGSVSGLISSCPCPRYRGLGRDYDSRGFQLSCDPVILSGEVVGFLFFMGFCSNRRGELGGWCHPVVEIARALRSSVLTPES
jgi:hypothetical protein